MVPDDLESTLGLSEYFIDKVRDVLRPPQAEKFLNCIATHKADWKDTILPNVIVAAEEQDSFLSEYIYNIWKMEAYLGNREISRSKVLMKVILSLTSKSDQTNVESMLKAMKNPSIVQLIALLREINHIETQQEVVRYLSSSKVVTISFLSWTSKHLDRTEDNSRDTPPLIVCILNQISSQDVYQWLSCLVGLSPGVRPRFLDLCSRLDNVPAITSVGEILLSTSSPSELCIKIHDYDTETTLRLICNNEYYQCDEMAVMLQKIPSERVVLAILQLVLECKRQFHSVIDSMLDAIKIEEDLFDTLSLAKERDSKKILTLYSHIDVNFCHRVCVFLRNAGDEASRSSLAQLFTTLEPPTLLDPVLLVLDCLAEDIVTAFAHLSDAFSDVENVMMCQLMSIMAAESATSFIHVMQANHLSPVGVMESVQYACTGNTALAFLKVLEASPSNTERHLKMVNTNLASLHEEKVLLYQKVLLAENVQGSESILDYLESAVNPIPAVIRFFSALTAHSRLAILTLLDSLPSESDQQVLFQLLTTSKAHCQDLVSRILTNYDQNLLRALLELAEVVQSQHFTNIANFLTTFAAEDAEQYILMCRGLNEGTCVIIINFFLSTSHENRKNFLRILRGFESISTQELAARVRRVIECSEKVGGCMVKVLLDTLYLVDYQQRLQVMMHVRDFKEQHQIVSYLQILDSLPSSSVTPLVVVLDKLSLAARLDLSSVLFNLNEEFSNCQEKIVSFLFTSESDIYAAVITYMNRQAAELAPSASAISAQLSATVDTIRYRVPSSFHQLVFNALNTPSNVGTITNLLSIIENATTTEHALEFSSFVLKLPINGLLPTVLKVLGPHCKQFPLSVMTDILSNLSGVDAISALLKLLNTHKDSGRLLQLKLLDVLRIYKKKKLLIKVLRVLEPDVTQVLITKITNFDVAHQQSFQAFLNNWKPSSLRIDMKDQQEFLSQVMGPFKVIEVRERPCESASTTSPTKTTAASLTTRKRPPVRVADLQAHNNVVVKLPGYIPPLETTESQGPVQPNSKSHSSTEEEAVVVVAASDVEEKAINPSSDFEITTEDSTLCADEVSKKREVVFPTILPDSQGAMNYAEINTYCHSPPRSNSVSGNRKYRGLPGNVSRSFNRSKGAQASKYHVPSTTKQRVADTDEARAKRKNSTIMRMMGKKPSEISTLEYPKNSGVIRERAKTAIGKARVVRGNTNKYYLSDL